MISTFSFWKQAASSKVGNVIGSSTTGLWFSSDAGSSWRRVTSNTGNGNLTFNSSSFTGNIGVSSSPNTGAWISSNVSNANSWIQGANGISSNIKVNSTSKNLTGNVLYFGTSNGVYTSASMGNINGTWTTSNTSSGTTTTTSVLGGQTNQVSTSFLLVPSGTSNIYQSSNFGNTWTILANTGIPSVNVNATSDMTYSYGNFFVSTGNAILRFNLLINSGQGSIPSGTGNITSISSGSYLGSMYTLVYYSNGPVFRTSDNGVSWSNVGNIGFPASSAAYGKQGFVSVSGGMSTYGANGGNSFSSTASFAGLMGSVFYANNIFMAVPSSVSSNLYCYTGSGGSWTVGGNVGMTCASGSGLTYRKGVWYAIPPSGSNIAYSTDNGNTWSTIPMGINQTWYSISSTPFGVYASGNSTTASKIVEVPKIPTVVSRIFPGNVSNTMYAVATIPPAIVKSTDNGNSWTSLGLSSDVFGNVLVSNSNIVMSSQGSNNKPSLYWGDPPKPARSLTPPNLSFGVSAPASVGNVLPIISMANGTLLRISSTATNTVSCTTTTGSSFTAILPANTTWGGAVTAENVTVILPVASNVPVAITYDNGLTWDRGGMIPTGTRPGSYSAVIYSGGAIVALGNTGYFTPDYGKILVSYDLGLTWGFFQPNITANFAGALPNLLIGNNTGDVAILVPNSASYTVMSVGTATGSIFNTALNDTWSSVGTWTYAAYGITPTGQGIYVVLNSNPTTGPAGSIYATSLNYNTWSASNLPLGSWKCLFYAGGFFITANSTGTIAYSSDGISWTTQSGFTNGIYALGGSGGGTMLGYTSTNVYVYRGIMPTSAAFTTVNSGSRILAIDTKGMSGTSYSDDGGQTWTNSTVTNSPPTQITSNNLNIAVLLDSGGFVNYSTDSGVFWNQTGYTGITLAYVGGQFLLGTNGGGVYTSSDGINWIQDATANTTAMLSFAT